MIEPTGYTALDLIGFTDKGGYDPDAYYVKNDIVTVGNTKWRCLIDDTHNITPTEGVNWTIYLESATSLAGMDDVDLNSPTDGDIVVYNGTSQKWENSDALSSKMSWADYAKTGAYNLCPVLNTTQVINGVTWTVNSDGTVTANCSSNNHAKSIFWIWADSTLRLSFPYTIRVCGAPSGAASNTYHMGGAGIPGGELYTETNITANTNIGLALVVAENAVVDNIVFKPMITADLNATYADYRPYAMTNRELTEKLVRDVSMTGGTNTSISRQKSFVYGNGGIHIYAYLTTSASVAANETILNLPSGYTFNGEQDIIAICDGAITRIYCNGGTLKIPTSVASGKHIVISGEARIN